MMDIKFYDVFDKDLKNLKYDKGEPILRGSDIVCKKVKLVINDYSVTCFHTPYENQWTYRMKSNIQTIKSDDLANYIVEIVKINKPYFRQFGIIGPDEDIRFHGSDDQDFDLYFCFSEIIDRIRQMDIKMEMEYGYVNYNIRWITGDNCEIQRIFRSFDYPDYKNIDTDIKFAIRHIYSPNENVLMIYKYLNKYLDNSNISCIITDYLFNQMIGFDSTHNQYSNILSLNNKLIKHYNSSIANTITKYLYKRVLGYDYYMTKTD